MLGALRRPVDQQDRGRRGDHVDHADQRLLRHARAPGAREGEQHGGEQCEGERIAVGREILRRVAEHEGDRRAERGDLRERQIDEDDFARQHLDAEIGVDADETDRHEERRPEKCERLAHRAAAGQRRDIGVEQRDVIAGLRQRADRSCQRHDRRAGLARHELDVALRLVRLAHDDAHVARLHGAHDSGEMRGARRHAGLHLDEADEIQPEAAREIRPAVVIGDDRHGP